MKITLYMATTIDGFIAKKDGDSEWVSPVDTVNFEKKIQEMGCIVVGRKTFDQFQGDLYPVEGITNIVLSTQEAPNSIEENVFYASSVQEVVSLAKRKGHENILLIGGGTVNGAFLHQGLIDEVILSVHPLIFGQGIKLFEGVETDVSLRLISQKEIGEGLVQLHYRVER